MTFNSIKHCVLLNTIWYYFRTV